MHYGPVFNSFQEMYNAKSYIDLPVGVDRYREWSRSSSGHSDRALREGEDMVNAIADRDFMGFLKHQGRAAQEAAKAWGTTLHTTKATEEAGRAIRSGYDAAKAFWRGNRRRATDRINSSLAHAGRAVVRTAQIPTEIRKTMASRFA